MIFCRFLSISSIELLTCIQHLFSWIPLDELISEYFLVSIFDLARWREHQCEVSVAALAAINEIFYLQRAIPQPKTVMNSVKGLLEQSNLEKSDERYQDKFTELLRLYTTKCWSKLIDDEHAFAPIILALYRYTFAGKLVPLSIRGICLIGKLFQVMAPLLSRSA